MSYCTLHVTTDEYDQILQWNHSTEMWSNKDQQLLHKLEPLLGKDQVDRIRAYDRCRMRKHDSLQGFTRVEENDDPAEGNPFPIHFSEGDAGHAPLEVEKLEGRQESGRDEEDESWKEENS